MLVRTRGRHGAREAFKAVLLPGKHSSNLSLTGRVLGTAWCSASQCVAVLEKRNIGVELCVAIPAPDSGNYNQCWAGMLHQSEKCTNAQLPQSWLVLANRKSITVFSLCLEPCTLAPSLRRHRIALSSQALVSHA